MQGGGALVNAVTTTDEVVLDGAVQGTAELGSSLGGFFGKAQSGYVRNYGSLMVLGTVAVGLVVVLSQIAGGM